jgi:hypothetical protein
MKWDLRSKIGVWQMPLFKFLHPKRWRLKSSSWREWRDLNTEYTILDLRCRECLWCKCECETLNLVENGITRDKLLLPEKRVTFTGKWHKWPVWERENNKRVPESIEEKDPTPLGKQSSFTGEKTAYDHASDNMSMQYEKTKHYLLSNEVIA